MIRHTPRKRRALNLEKLDQRLVLAAPIGNPDTYNVNEDAVLGTGSGAILSANFEGTAPPVVLATGSTWSYLDKIQNNLGLNQTYPTDGGGRTWNSPSFDIATSTISPWGSAPAPLVGGVVQGGAIIDAFPAAPNVLDGVDDAPNGTDNLVITYLFRTTFTLTAAQAAAPSGAVRVLCDDGCIGYINGVEAYRLNMPTGAITTNTFALNSTDVESGLTTIPVNFAGLGLGAGVNTFAVELHQNANTSSDAGFELELSAGSLPTSNFTYTDDVLGTARAGWENGAFQPAGGFNGTGGLEVRLQRAGGFGFGDTSASGGWSRTINLPSAATVTVSTRYRLSLSSEADGNDYGQAVLAVDGTRFGVAMPAGQQTPALAQFTGNGNGGAVDDSGWQLTTVNVPLSAGNHTITLAAYINAMGDNAEFTEAWFDDVTITGPGGAPGVLFNDTDGDNDPLTAVLVDNVAHGTLTFNPDGTFLYSPAANFHGADGFTYRASDGTDQSAITAVTLNVASVNDAPVGSVDTYAVVTNNVLTVPAASGVLTNDSDVDLNPLTATLSTSTAQGILQLASDGSFTYTPPDNFVGRVTFTYRPNDGTVDGNVTTATINVIAANGPPVTTPDQYRVDENGTLAITQAAPIPPYQAFFSNFDGGTLPTQVSGPTAMTLTPVGGYAGRGPEENTFTGNFLRNTADNTGGGNAPATTVTLSGLPPHTKVDLNFLLAIIDSWEGNTAGGFGGGGNAPDRFNVRVDGVTVFSETFDTANVTDQSYSPPPGGLFIDGEDLGFAQNNGNYVDSAYNMGLEPRLHGIPHTASTLTVDFFASGQGWTGNTNNVESFALDNLEVVVTNDAIIETDLVANNASWRYLDNGSNQGTAWKETGFNDTSWELGIGQFGYGDGDETTTIDFGPDENDKYVTTYFRHGFNIADPTQFGDLRLELLRDDGAAVYLNGVEVVRDNLPADAAYNTYALGTIPNFDETRYFTFDVDPSLLVAGTNVLAVEIHQAEPDSSDISFAARLVGVGHNQFGVLGNDVDVEGGSMTADLVQSTTRGALTFNSNGTFTYTPNPNAFGTDTFSYRASDGTLWSQPTTVTITIVPGPNEAPTSLPESYSVVEDEVLSVPANLGLLVNDTDVELDPLTAQQVTGPAHGTLSLAADGSFVYTPNADYFGPDSFTYRAFDGLARSALTTVSIEVTGVNDVPTAVNDSYFAEVGQTLSITPAGVLTNDLNPDQGAATVQLVASTAHGTLDLHADGSFTYTPNAGFHDFDSFAYRMSDGNDVSNIATVTFDVGYRPVAMPDQYTGGEDAPLSVGVGSGVLMNDSDGDDDPLTAILMSAPAHGTLTLNTNGSFDYMPAANYAGPDSFSYRISDGGQFSNPATVSITVTPVNDPPIAVADQYEAFSGTALTTTAAEGVLANDIDVDGQPLSAVLIGDVSNGTLALAENGSFTYTPDIDFHGTDTFTYRATDGTLFSPIRTVTFTVEPAALRIQINEIMYHPLSENDAEEYIELVNTGTATVNLSGWQFTQGVSFTTPNVPQATLGAGQFLVVAADAAAFAAKYPGVTNVVAGWTGQLSNRGEEIELSDAAGNRVDRVEYADEGDWAVRRRGPLDNGHEGWVWVAQHDGLGSSLELVNANVSNNVGQNWLSSTVANGTPGTANSVADADIAPLISDVIHSPAIPRPDDSVTITARLRDEVDSGVSARLFWRVSTATPPPFTQAPMYDDGLHGDGAAGDGLYAAILPARADRAVVEFYVRATDAAANVRTWPGPTTDTGVQGANATYQVDNTFAPLAPGQAPIYRLVMTVPEDTELTNINRNTNALINTTVIFQTGSGIDVRYNAGVRPRGQGDRQNNPITMRLELPHDRPWNGAAKMNLNSQWAPNEIIGHAMFGLANLPAPDGAAIRLRRNGRTDNSTAGFSTGFYTHMEVVDNDWAENHLPDDSEGNVYSKRRPDNKWAYRAGNVQAYEADGWNKQSNSAIPDWSDIDEFLRVMNQASGATYYDQVAEVANIDQFVHYFALMALMNSRETSIHNGTDDDYDMYRGAIDTRFIFVPHDLDTIFGQGDTQTNFADTIFPAITQAYSGTTLPALRPFFQNPQIVVQYYAALKEYAETTFVPAIFGPFVDQLLTGIATQNTINNIKNYAEQRRQYVLSQIPTALTVNHNLTLQDGFPRTTNPATVVLNGQADVTQTAKVLVGGVAANWDPFNRSWTTAAGTGGNTQVIMPRGSTWKYLADGTNQGTAWIQPGFDDSAWSSGPAELGYGDGGEATVVNCGPSAPACNNGNLATTYFRTTFNVADLSQFSGVRVLLRRDDGAAVYLNGQEVIRDNIAPGAAFDAFANGTDQDDGNTYFEFPLTGLGGLRQGANTLAVEVKQANATSSDISFDLEVVGVVTQTGTGISLLPGINRVLVQSLDAADVELSRGYLDVWYDDGSEQTVPLTTISTDTTWTAASGPYRVTGNVTVAAGATLTIEPGTSVYFNAGTGLVINGRLVAEGTDTKRIRLRPAPGSTAAWAGIRFANTTQDNRVAYLDMENGDSRGDSIEAVNSVITLDHLTWVGTAAQILELTDASFHISNSVFPGISGGNDGELIHGNGILAGGHAIIDGNTFGVTNGYNDVIDFTGGQRPGPILQVLNNVFTGGSDDALDLDGTDAHIEGNIFKHFHKNNTSDSTSNAIATGFDGGNNSEITVARNFFYDNDHAVLVKEGSFLTFINNTVVGSAIAGINFDEPERQNVQPGLGAIVDGSIFEGPTPAFQNVYVNDPVEGTTQLTVNHSLVPAANLGLGTGNLDIALGARLANPAGDDFSLKAGSAAMGTGPNGIDMGADVPGWANIAGEPPAVTSTASATLTVNGPGLTHYRYALDGGPFGAETTIGTPISLAGLGAGPHAVKVIGHNSAGVYQSEADATMSRAWTVAPGHIDLRINEVLAVNTSAYNHEGSYPDVIELYNYGSTPIDLSGMTLSDDAGDADKFVFPAGATIGAGQYLVLFAATPNGASGLHLGFNLDRNGETLTLYQSAAAGAPMVDQMSFGIQIPNYSVGVGADHAWGLNVPTIGAANIAQRTGDPMALSINEWLAVEDRLYRNDRLELHNADSLPVALGGLRLTDNPIGKPDKHEIAPLSFIAPTSFAVLVPDENSSAGADHLNFNLDAQQELLGLLTPDLERIDVVLYMSQSTDVSQGRMPDDGTVYTSLNPPNFGFPNTTAFNADALLDNLRITELMYNPLGGQTYEFVELKNTSVSQSLNLAGVSFTGGIDYEFGAITLGPNEYIVVAKDLAAFQSRYCGGAACTTIHVVGPFGGQLDNTGENLELTLPDPFDGTIHDFSFDDAWYAPTDGSGPSLVIRDPLAAVSSWDSAASWRTSGLPEGSPGSDDPLDGIAPQVAHVLVSGTRWTGSFLTSLDVRTLGQRGYIVAPGSAALPWSTIDEITVEFNEPVVISQPQFALQGVNVADYPVAAFTSDGMRATWTLAAPIAADKLRLVLPAGIADTSGNAMSSSYSFRFDVLPGDMNGDGTVNFNDVIRSRDYLYTRATLTEYDPLQDIDSNGRVSVADWIRIRNLSGTTLPAGEPGAGGSPAASAIVHSGPTARTSVPRADIRVTAVDRVLSASRRVNPGGVSDRIPANESAPTTTQLRASRQRRNRATAADAHDAIFSNL